MGNSISSDAVANRQSELQMLKDRSAHDQQAQEADNQRRTENIKERVEISQDAYRELTKAKLLKI